MSVKRSVKYFRGTEGYNCAQAILKAFEEEHNISQEQIDSFKSMGGGRAKDGECGALHAAKALLNNHEQKECIADSFQKSAGSSGCREIRKLKRITCKDCVKTAARLLVELHNVEGETDN